MIDGELFGRVYFATLPIPGSCTYLESLCKFGFWF